MNKLLLGTALLCSLTACASVPPLNFSPSNIGMSQTKQDAALISTTVTVASKSEAKGSIEVAGAESNVEQLWKTALDDAILRVAIFRDDSPKKLSLAVKILKLDLPAAGIVMVTHTIARYELIDRNNGDVVFTTDVDTDGRVNGSDAFLGMTRARDSASLSVQNNIAQFLQQLETADLNKPMFPGGRQHEAGTTAK